MRKSRQTIRKRYSPSHKKGFFHAFCKAMEWPHPRQNSEREAMDARCPHLAPQQTGSNTFIKCSPRHILATVLQGEVRTPRIHGFAL